MQNIHISLFCFFVLELYLVKAQTSCTTPNGETARCISIDNCKLLYDSVLTNDPQVVNFLRASQCGFNGRPLVCCGTTASYAPPSTAKPLVRRPELLPDNACGVQDAFRIFNGQDTWPNEYPWTALIRYRNSSGFEQFSCGGTVINNRYILTAAHCVVGGILKVVGTPSIVRLGEWNTATDRDCYEREGIETCSDKPVDFGIEKITAHSEYSDSSIHRQHDIAVIRLNRPITFSDYIQPVCLPKANDQVSIGKRLDVVGWGRTEKGTYSSIKQKLDVPVIEDIKCRSVFSRAGVNLRNTQLCAGGEKGKDSCSGDSGGPLLGHKNKIVFLYGVVSFGADCGTEGWPGIYTKVSEYRDWIEGNISA